MPFDKFSSLDTNEILASPESEATKLLGPANFVTINNDRLRRRSDCLKRLFKNIVYLLIATLEIRSSSS